MEEKDNNSLAPMERANNPSKIGDSLISDIIETDDPDKLKDLTHLFNNLQVKKNIVRANKINNLLDGVTDEMVRRIESTPDNFSNDDLSKWLKIAQDVLQKKENYTVDDTPIISLMQNNQININVVDTLSRESRENIMSAVQEFLKNSQAQQLYEQEDKIDYIEEEKEDC